MSFGTQAFYDVGPITLKPGRLGTGVNEGGAVLVSDASDDIVYSIRADSGLPVLPLSAASTPTHNSGGGTNPTITGTAHAFLFTFGSSGTPAATLVLDFPSGVISTNAVAVCNYRNGGSIRAYVESLDTNSITIKFVGGTPSTGSKLDVMIVGLWSGL